ncbi:unnamed protein product [Choristocarpus tenellus]
MSGAEHDALSQDFLLPQTQARTLTHMSLSPDDEVFRCGGSEAILSADESSNGRSRDHVSWFVVNLTFISALGGFLFGYDTGVVSGAMLLLTKQFDLSDFQEEVVVSITIAGAILASMVGGRAMSHFGRRPVILLAAAIFTVGAIVLAAAQTYDGLVLGRLVVGIGIGLASLATPVYIAEASPSHLRGTLVTLNTLLITLGQFAAGVVDGLYSETDGGWRYMLGLSGVPSLIMFFGFIFLPESPRWLVSSGRHRDALTVLEIIRGTKDVQVEMKEIIDSAAEDEGTTGGSGRKTVRFIDLLGDPPVRRALILGCGLQALQQLSGINTVMYYSATVFSMAGFSVTSSIWLAAFSALAQALGVSLGLYLIERCGRRVLLLSSLLLVVVTLFVLGLGFKFEDVSIEDDDSGTASDSTSSSPSLLEFVIVASMLGYLFSFGVGMSSIPWTLNAEIYPMYARSLGTSASTSVNWVGNLIISSTFLTIASNRALGRDGAFWLYSGIGALGWVWLYSCMPETKGLSLEEIELLFVREGERSELMEGCVAEGGAFVGVEEGKDEGSGAVHAGGRRHGGAMGFARLQDDSLET